MKIASDNHTIRVFGVEINLPVSYFHQRRAAPSSACHTLYPHHGCNYCGQNGLRSN